MIERIFAILMALCFAASCSEDVVQADGETCPGGEQNEYRGALYCVFSGPIIETRFDCPAMAPVQHDLGETIVCTEDQSLPPNFQDPDPWPVGENPDDPVLPPPPCDHGFETSCSAPSTTRSGTAIADDLARLLWNDVPDTALLGAANRGDLSTRDGVEAQVRRMLDDPRAVEGLGDFWAAYLGIENVAAATLDQTTYPSFDASLASLMLDSTLSTIHQVTLVDKADTRSIFSTDTVVAESRVGSLLGLSVSGTTPSVENLGQASDRRGVLAHPSFMTAHSTEQFSHPSIRGTSIRAMLCESVPPPPDTVGSMMDPVPDGTRRSQLEFVTSPPECTACHAIIDQPAFALEGLDALGRTRTADNGFPVDESGELDGLPLDGATDLGLAMEADPRVATCMVRKLARFSMGAPLEDPLAAEDAYASALESHWSSNGWELEELLVAILTSDRFLAP